jgi:hypothetical protein
MMNGTPASTQNFTSPQNTQTQWLFRADLQTWVPVADMTLNSGTYTDNMPFPSELDDLFIGLLAKRMAPRYSKTVSKDTEDMIVRMFKTFKTRYRQSQPTVYGSSDIPRSLQSYISGRWWW